MLQTTIVVLLTIRDYFPPNFHSDFLNGRSRYFFGAYQWAFYAHILSGPFTLFAGLVLLSDSVRRRFPAWHRRLGRVQVLCVLLLVTPSGLWMARFAATGAVAGVGFAMLAIATALCAAMGWRRAVQRRFDEHRQWMLRCYVLLCSAVVLRKIGGLSEILEVEGTYPIAAWISWLLPLIVLECLWLRNRFSTVNR
ncbi:hypothetical protein Pr1d_48030 [Bythopirellula goksoeyrii]|uniref:DUF2306 domain-containing protein n=1 Tax=Bythopirellula goksoeyrii TaxID=1400387 RepID=A0A5B9QEJ0_9BACT|nr:hypothetical protein Pr1d_48030 [Bythopirellula goksoeyrii]